MFDKKEGLHLCSGGERHNPWLTFAGCTIAHFALFSTMQDTPLLTIQGPVIQLTTPLFCLYIIWFRPVLFNFWFSIFWVQRRRLEVGFQIKIPVKNPLLLTSHENYQDWGKQHICTHQQNKWLFSAWGNRSCVCGLKKKVNIWNAVIKKLRNYHLRAFNKIIFSIVTFAHSSVSRSAMKWDVLEFQFYSENGKNSGWQAHAQT